MCDGKDTCHGLSLAAALSLPFANLVAAAHAVRLFDSRDYCKMNPNMMNPDMMKAAQDMMSKMSPEEMQKMMKMQQQMCAKRADSNRRELSGCTCTP